MPWCIPKDEAWEMVALRFEDGLSCREVAKRMKCLYDKNHVWRVCTYYLETGQVPVLNTHKRPRQDETTHLDRNASKVLWQLYDDDAALYIDEATQILNN
jgi:hypothetical protein